MSRFKPRKASKGKKKHSRQTLPKELADTFELGLSHHQAGLLAEAENAYRYILQHRANHAPSLHMLGVIATQTGQFTNAIALLEEALGHDPADARCLYNLGVCYQQIEDQDQAIQAYARACRLDSGYIDARVNLAVCLRDNNQLAMAIVELTRAAEIKPYSAQILNNLGTFLKMDGQVEKSIQTYQQALVYEPDNADIHLNLSGSLLDLEQYEAGWKSYDWRLKSEKFLNANTLTLPPAELWRGEPLKGRRVLVCAEQGIGDEIMFASCIPQLLNEVSECWVECDPRLTGLFERSFPACHFRSKEEGRLPTREQADLTIYSGSLPSIYRRNRHDFPTSPYLVADPQLKKQYTSVLRSLPGRLKVGLSWRGGRDPRTRGMRSIPLSHWGSLFDHQEIDFINLQYGDCRAEIDDCGLPLLTMAGIDPLTDMESFAALVDSLDLVISVDNSTVHVAGALGKPCLTILPLSHDWRWFRSLDSSPWYPSLRLLRSTSTLDNTTDLMAQISRDLKAMLP